MDLMRKIRKQHRFYISYTDVNLKPQVTVRATSAFALMLNGSKQTSGVFCTKQQHTCWKIPEYTGFQQQQQQQQGSRKISRHEQE